MADELKNDDTYLAGAVTYKTSDGTIFLAPQTANFPAAYAYGKLISTQPLGQQKVAIGAAISHSGFYDFQRHSGTFYKSHTDASNYVVGVVMNGAGYSWIETETIAATFATLYSKHGWTSSQSKWWYYGFLDAKNGQLPRPPYPTAIEPHQGG